MSAAIANSHQIRQYMGTAVRTAKTSPASWDAFRDIEVFVDEVLAELAAMAADGTRPTRHRAEAAIGRSGAAQGDYGDLVCRRSAACSGVPSVSSATSRSTRCTPLCPLDPARAMAPAARPAAPHLAAACGDTADPSTVVIDSRSCRSAPSCFTRGIDGGKKIRGVKIQVAVDKHGIPLAIDVAPANTHDTKGIVPVLRQLAGQGFRGSALGDPGYRGKRLAKAGQKLGITGKAVARGWDGKFLPTGICWVVEVVFTQMTKADVLAFGAGGQHVTDLNVGIGGDHAVDEQQHELPALLKGGFGKSVLDARAEGLQ